MSGILLNPALDSGVPVRAVLEHVSTRQIYRSGKKKVARLSRAPLSKTRRWQEMKEWFENERKTNELEVFFECGGGAR